MKKLIGLIGFLLIMSMGLASATNVDCGWGQHANCNEDEVQDAVDDLDDDIEELEEDIEDVEYDVNRNNRRIRRLRNNLGDTNDYIEGNEEAWLKDEVGGSSSSGSGMSSDGLSRYLTGFSNVFDIYDNFIDYLIEVFATNNALEEANLRIDELEARLNLLNYWAEDATDKEITKAALVIGANRRGEDLVINGMICKAGLCIKVE